MTMKQFFAFLWVASCFIFAGTAMAQEESLQLKLSRDFGYGGFNGEIEGTFSYRVDELDNLVRVEFLLDDVVIGEDQEAPFRLQFHTSNYDFGVHELQARGYLADGRTLESNVITRNFVEPADVLGFLKRILIPLFVVIGLAVLVPATFSIMSARRNPIPLGASRKYSRLLGGAICTQCHRPFSIHFWSVKLGIGRLDRCPHCGKWHFVKRANQEQLKAAELAELGDQAPPSRAQRSEEEKLRHLLDDSRYEDQ